MSEEQKNEAAESDAEENAEALTEEQLESADGGQSRGGRYVKSSGDPSAKAGRYK